MEAALSLGHETPSSSPSRVSPIGSSKRKSKPVKRIVDHIEEKPMGNADIGETTPPRPDTREQPSPVKVEDLVKPATAMDQSDMLRKLTELLANGQLSLPGNNLFPNTFPSIFTNVTGCPMDMAALSTNISEMGTPTTVPSLLGMSLPNAAVKTPTSMPPTAASIVHSVERFVNRTPTTHSSSLANSKGPVKRKLFEGSRDLMRAVAAGITKEERIDLDDLENFAQMFKKQRIKFGFTQGDVGVALGRRYGTDFSQTTISRFEALNLSFKNMCKLRPLLKEWLTDAEAAIANGATVTDLLDRPTAEKSSPKPDATIAAGDCAIGGEPAVKRRRKRTNLDVAQRTTLDAYFAMNPRPDHERMTEIANLLELDRDVVRVWFCNRRQKMRRADEPEVSEDPLMVSLRAIAQQGDRTDEIS